MSTALNEMTLEQQGFQSELTSLTKETADQVRMAVARNDAVIDVALRPPGHRHPKVRKLAGRPERARPVSTTPCRAAGGFLART